MVKNFFITGKPGCGKTSLIIEILKELDLDAGGFYTQEIREKEIRKGFKIVTLNDKEGILAHINIKSPYRVSRYKVNIRGLEKIGVESILKAIKENKVIVIDEIGAMELFSKKFQEAVLAALNSLKQVLGIITITPNPFCDKIKKRQDTKIFYLTRGNRDKIKSEIEKLL